MVRYFRIRKDASWVNKVPILSSSPTALKGAPSSSSTGQNRLYNFTTRLEFEVSPDVVTIMLKLFSFDVYCLLNSGSTVSYVTPYMVVSFDFGLACVSDLFLFLPW